jgi:hypothetical protein
VADQHETPAHGVLRQRAARLHLSEGEAVSTLAAIAYILMILFFVWLGEQAA